MTKAGPERPSVVSILTDDQGPWALGCAGNPEIRTPHLDRLAAEGVRFDRFFCASPVCSPARASLMTGRMPSHHGVHDWLREGNSGPDAVAYLAGRPTWTGQLAEAGYRCGFSGKWHLGDSARPQCGFTHWYAHEGGGGPYYGAPMFRDGRLVHEPGYISDVITDDAIAYIERSAAAGGPFCACVHFTAPHSPWIGNHPPEIVASYDDCPFASCPVELEHPWALRNSVPDQARELRREHLKGYFAAVTALDANVGRILAALERLGLHETTLVLFTSDNGYNCGHHGVWGKGNGTFPLNMYDESVLVPTIIAHPGAIPGGRVCHDLLSHCDVMPTLLDYLGVAIPDREALPGASFAGLLRGDATAGRDHVVVFDEYGPVRMIRTTEWKYVHRYPYGPHELYRLLEDPGERVNLAADAAFARVRQELKAELDGWFVRHADPEVDGVREAVFGKGQIAPAGSRGGGRKAYADDIVCIEGRPFPAGPAC